MAFLRFTRDKRGYEHFYLVEPSQRRGKPPTRVLYWFRTPPNVKIGREPFDDRVRRELETQNPDVVFDWRRILETPIPSADAEKWRERRRAERAAKASRRTEKEPEAQEVEPADEEATEPVPPSGEALESAEAESTDEGEPEGEEQEDADDSVADAPVHVLEAAAATVPLDSAVPPDLSPPHASNEGTDAHPPADGAHRKRRRRRRRRGHGGQPGTGGGSPAGGPAGDV